MVDILREVSRDLYGGREFSNRWNTKEAILYWIRKDTGSQ